MLHRTNETLQNYVATLVAADSRQLELNIDSYLAKVENTVSLLFSDEKYYQFDATDTSLSSYDKIQAEDAIDQEIVRLGLTENFSDFGIVYANDENTGMISEVTTAMYPDQGMYQAFASSINREKTMDGWSFGYQHNYDRLYYTKRLNEHAIAVVSFYGRELETVFELPEQLQSMTIRLVNDDNQILYSSDDNEVGSTLQSDIADAIQKMDSSVTVLQGAYLINSNTCSNGWRVVCTIPVQEIMKDGANLRTRMVQTVAVIALIILLIGFLFYLRMSRSMTGMVDNLSDQAEHDLMTDLLNKQTFEKNVSRELASYTGKQANVFLMFDLDNFKQVNDCLGHAKGDEVICRFARVLRETLPHAYVIGRLGGDEFAAFIGYTEISQKEAEEQVHVLIDTIYTAFSREFAHEREQTGLSVSAGVVVAGPGDYTFDDLYKRADRNLYVSKRNGKDQATYES
ncbi:MAG: sensor domain-containing diguanylate cyclase [Bilifractor sp.]